MLIIIVEQDGAEGAVKDHQSDTPPAPALEPIKNGPDAPALEPIAPKKDKKGGKK